jgi:hypothetical protein
MSEAMTAKCHPDSDPFFREHYWALLIGAEIGQLALELCGILFA